MSGEYDCQFVFVMKLTAVLNARSGVIAVAFAGACACREMHRIERQQSLQALQHVWEQEAE